MADIYSGGGGSRRTAVLVGIIGLHLLFYLALVSGLAREAMQLVQDVGIIDLPPPPPPPEDLKEPPPPPPTDLPPPVVPPPLIDLPSFSGPTTAITAEVRDKPAAPAPRVAAPAPRQVVVKPPSFRVRPERFSALVNRCYPSASRRLNEEGRVVMTLTVAANGQVTGAKVSQSSGFERLDNTADCLIQSFNSGKVFNPGTSDGSPTQMEVSVPIVFRLE